MSPTEIFYVVIGLLSIAVVFYSNADLFKGSNWRAGSSALEVVYYLIAVVAPLTSYAFGIALFLAIRERQLRCNAR